MCVPPEFAFNWLFGFVPDILKIMCVSMLVVSIGKYLKFYERKTYEVIKWILYIWFLLYLAYVLDYFNLTGDWEGLDWLSIILSIIAPFGLFIAWTCLKSYLKNKLPFDVYYLAMLIYYVIGVIWWVLRPEQINLSFYTVYVFFLAIIGNYLVSHLYKGIIPQMDAKMWRRVLIVLKIIGFTVFVAILKIIVLSFEPEENLQIEAWWFGLGGIALFGILSILYFQTIYRKYFVLLMLGSESLLFVDIHDFLAIFITPLGVILFMIITLCGALVLYFYTKRAKAIGIALLIAVIFSVAFLLFVAINNEKAIENWAVGISFATLFIILYLLPPGKLWIVIKRVHLTLILFFMSLFLLDFTDYLIAIKTIYF